MDDPENVEQTPEDGAALLDTVKAFLCRFVAFPSEAAGVAVALWAGHAHLSSRFESTPRLALLSPEPESGKTRTLEILDLLVPSPLHAFSASCAAVFRSIDAGAPTLLLDEVDTIFGRHGKDPNAEDLRALVNAGHRRGATIPRCVGPTHEVRLFEVFAPVALAGIGSLPATIMSRSVVIQMRRRAAGEVVHSYRHRKHAPEGHELREALAAWAAGVADEVAVAEPEMPPGVDDRPADAWEPLLAVADAAGGDWPVRAREACAALVKVAASREPSLGVRLLADVHAAFTVRDGKGEPTDKHHAVLTTEQLLDALHGMEEAPWGHLKGEPLSARRLAGLLKEYGIGSVKVRQGEKSLQGYRREHFWDSWERYLPDLCKSGTSGTSGTSQVTSTDGGSGLDAGSGTSTASGTGPTFADQRGSAGSESSGSAAAVSTSQAPQAPQVAGDAGDAGQDSVPSQDDEMRAATELVVRELGGVEVGYEPREETEEETG